jgi:DNA-binding transcriptional ArsR family regulator
VHANELRSLGLADGSLWAAIISYVVTHGPADDEAIFDWLAADQGELAAAFIEEFGWSAGEETVAGAQAGDPEAMEAVVDGCKPHLRENVQRLLQVGSDLGPRLAALSRSIRSMYGERGDNWATAIERSAISTSQLAEVMAPRDLVEYITSGLDFEIPLGMTRLIAVPSVTLRPWTLVTEFGDALIVSYSVDDDHMNADPESAPGWLVRYHKALGDGRRLRILRHLAQQPATLAQLTEMLGLAKSTVFHHIGVLRSAGLVRVTLDPDHDGATSYEVRWKALGEARTQIDKYLEPSDTKE